MITLKESILSQMGMGEKVTLRFVKPLEMIDDILTTFRPKEARSVVGYTTGAFDYDFPMYDKRRDDLNTVWDELSGKYERYAVKITKPNSREIPKSARFGKNGDNIDATIRMGISGSDNHLFVEFELGKSFQKHKADIDELFKKHNVKINVQSF